MRAECGLVDVLRNWKQCTCKLCQSPTRTQNAANATHPTRRFCVLWYTSPLPHMKIWEIPEDWVQTPKVPEVVHRLQPSLGLLEWSQFSVNQQWASAEKPEKKKKMLQIP